MNIHTSTMDEKSPRPNVATDAERWYARLKAGDCTVSEREEFDRWRSAPEHAAAYAETERLWQSLGKLAGRRGFAQLSERILAETAPGRRLGARHPLAMAASVLIALLVGSIFFELQRREAAATVYATRSGERRIIQLADGSQLVLNYATALDVRFSDHDRRLRLHKGEALFTVAHDATRPFKVDAGDGVVTALGTRFEVRTDADQVAVTLLEGRVSVDRRHVNAHVELEPGDQVHFEETSAQMTRRKVDTEFVTSWSTGRLRFRATPLAEVLDEVNRYSTTQIRIVDTTLGSIPISGTFEIGDTASVVAALNALLPIEATAKDREIQLRRRN